MEDTIRRVDFERTVHLFSDVIEVSGIRPMRISFPFARALKAEGISFIYEIKRASPSKGLISEDFPYLDIIKGYEFMGVSAISILTKPHYFRGDDRCLESYRELVESLGMSTPIEIHTENDIEMAVSCGASIIGLITGTLTRSRSTPTAVSA